MNIAPIHPQARAHMLDRLAEGLGPRARLTLDGLSDGHLRTIWQDYTGEPEPEPQTDIIINSAELGKKILAAERDARRIPITFLLLFLLSAFPLSALAQTIPDQFFRAIHTVETSGRTGPILGDGGRALGPYQIHRAYWQDANVPGRYEQVADERYARRVVTAYLTRYARAAVAQNDFQTLARVHNGGPRGHQRASTLPYWTRVRRHLNP